MSARKKSADYRNGWLVGFATALAEMHRGLIAAGPDGHVERVAREAGLTLAEAQRAGANQFDVVVRHFDLE